MTASAQTPPPATRREELLELAATMFAQRGLRATTVRDIADAAGILSGSLYHHFASKEEMVDEVLRTFLDWLFERYQRIIDTNLTAIFRACQVFGRYFLDQTQPASIINLGSISGLNPLSRVFTYSASKAAVHNLTRNLAREWADKDIRVNTLVPGFFPAEQNRKVLDESRVLDILRQTPASRFGNAEELIGATLLLASSKAGSFITGAEMIVDGGFHAMTI